MSKIIIFYLNIFFFIKSIGHSLITMFFALYTLGEQDDVLIEPFENQLTPNFGYVLFGMFHISNITILMSMLIAMMTKSFDTIIVIVVFV